MEVSRQPARTDSGQQFAPIVPPAIGSGQKRSAIFLDRDGVINVRRPSHVTSWKEFEFFPGALTAIRQLSLLDWPIVVATNQSAVGRGLLSADDLTEIHRRMVAGVGHAGGRIDLIVHCPHTPEDDCPCRKPRTGLFHNAARQLNVRLAGSYFIGDAPSDLGAAQQLEMTFVFVRTGMGTRALAENPILAKQAHWVADSIPDACQWILERECALVETRLGRRTA